MKLFKLSLLTIALALSSSISANAAFFNITGDIEAPFGFFDVTIETSGTSVIGVSTVGNFDGQDILGLSTFSTTNTFNSISDYDFAFLIDPVAGVDAVRLFTSPDRFQVGVELNDDVFTTGALTNVTVSAVPEPQTMAMLLAGLGLLGFVSRRKV